MAKRPYIQFYIGDYLKDTRVLPLNVRGAWVDLILYMWDADHKGELIGTMEEFSRLMCCSIDEANLVIQTLKQKNIFDYHDLPDGKLQIISRKQKKMVKLSETRSQVGKSGGNPALLVKQKDNLNAEVEYSNVLTQLESIYGPIEKPKIDNFMYLVVEMIKIFLSQNPEYFFDKEVDYSACLEIAYKIAAMKKWGRADVVEAKTKECLKSWETIVNFIKDDEWLKSRSLSDLATIKEWQRLVQKMNNSKSDLATTEKRMVL